MEAGDLLRTYDEDMASFIESIDLFGTEEGDQRRADVMKKLESIVFNWAMNLAKQRNGSKEDFMPKIQVFGSTRLGVTSDESDIDAVCITSYAIT
jgi:poly(A) polymerase Pap1